MSGSSASADSLISFAHQWQIEQYVATALVALLAYEYVITLSEEVSVVWQRKRTNATLLFVAIRYVALFYGLTLALADQLSGQTVSTPSYSCAVTVRLFESASLCLTVIFGLFSALRVYALWDRSLPLFTLIMAINLVPFCTNIYIFSSQRLQAAEQPVVSMCESKSQLAGGLVQKLIRASRLAVITGETLIVVLTWIKTMGIRREASSAHVRVKLSYLLMRDGTTFYLTLLVLNVIQVSIVQNTEVPGYMMAPINVLTPILISRFMLNLRRLDKGFEPTDELSYFNGPALRTLVPEEEEDGADIIEVQRRSTAPSDPEASTPPEDATSGLAPNEGSASSRSSERWKIASGGTLV